MATMTLKSGSILEGTPTEIMELMQLLGTANETASTPEPREKSAKKPAKDTAKTPRKGTPMPKYKAIANKAVKRAGMQGITLTAYYRGTHLWLYDKAHPKREDAAFRSLELPNPEEWRYSKRRGQFFRIFDEQITY